MKYKSALIKHKFDILALALAVCISLFLNLHAKDTTPPGFNTDEAAFGYNAYAIARTGLDEFGKIPLRLTSFGDFKLPLYSLLGAPFTAMMGLSEFSSRFVNTVIAALFPLLLFATLKKLKIGTFAAHITTLFYPFCFAPASISRQTHEGYLSAFLALLTFYTLLYLLSKKTFLSAVIYALSLLLFLHSYQSARAIGLILTLPLFAIYRANKKIFIFAVALCACAFAIFVYGDVLYPPARVKTLLVWNNPGFIWGIEHAREFGGSAILHNKLTHAVAHILYWHAFTFSPYFLAWAGDINPRFGLSGLAPITLAEYALFAFAAMHTVWVFAKNTLFRMPLSASWQKGRLIWPYILLIIFASPITSSITFQTQSITRILSVFPFIYLLVGYAVDALFTTTNKRSSARNLVIVLIILAIAQGTYTWRSYFTAFASNPKVLASWTPETRALGEFFKSNNCAEPNTEPKNTTSKKCPKIYIGNKLGMSHIFYAFYSSLDPRDYAARAVRAHHSDEYGFTKVTRIGNFVFETPRVEVIKRGEILVMNLEEYTAQSHDAKKSLQISFETKMLPNTPKDRPIYIFAKK